MKHIFKKIVLCASLILFAINQNVFAANENLKFVQLSDSHITLTREDTSFKVLSQSKQLLKDAINQINAETDIDFVLQTGDTIDRANESDIMLYMSLMNNLKYPWYVAFGNHDFSIEGTGKITREYYVKLLNSHNKNFNFDNTYYSFKPKKGFKVIVMDAIDNSKITGNGSFSEEQLKWLDKELNSAKRSTVLIFLHHPIIEPYPSSHHKILNTEDFYKVIDKYKNPIGIFSGHYHATKITKERNIVHVSTPALVTYPNAFRLVSVTNYKKQTIFDFYFKETNLKEVQQKAKEKSIWAPICAGLQKDQKTTIIIDK